MKPIKVLANADEVIRLLAREGELSPAEIAERLGMPRPSVYRLLDGLSAVGLTDPLRDSSASLSLRWLHLADRARESAREWRGAKGVLGELVERSGQTAFLSVPRGDEAVCLEWEQGRGIGVLVLRPGHSLPLYAGAAGRVLLAFGEQPDGGLAGAARRAFTPRTMLTDDELRADVERSRRQGFVLSDEDVTLGIAALGVPVRRPDGQVVGALSLAGMRAEVIERESECLPMLQEAADRLGSLHGS